MFPAHIRETGERQTVREHCRNTAVLAASALRPLGLEKSAYLAGLLHDAGKNKQEYAQYLSEAVSGGNAVRGSVNHTFAGVRLLLDRWHGGCGTFSYPDVHFMILDTEVSDIDNVASFTYATHECSFLAGIAAAMKSESDVIGFIGGMQIPTIEKFQVGFEEGVHYVKPDAKVIVKYIGNDSSAWNDPATAKTLTLDCIANGADVCYHAAGASGMGMVEACVENNIWAIGVNIDQTHLAPKNMLTSALTKGDRAVYLFTESCINGTPMSGMTVLNCANDGVGVVASEFMTDDIMTAVNDAAAKIVSGELKVTNVMSY